MRLGGDARQHGLAEAGFAKAGLAGIPHVAVNSTLVTATGTVAELTVNNQLTGVTLRYFGLKVDQGGSYALTGTGLDTLSDGSRVNAIIPPLAVDGPLLSIRRFSTDKLMPDVWQ